MLTEPEDFAATRNVLSAALDTDGARAWKRRALGLARALADEGHFAWEDFRQTLLVEQGSAALDVEHDWLHCQRWIDALSRVAAAAGLVDEGGIAELGRWAERAMTREDG